MALFSDETTWIFLLGKFKKSETRHINDIYNGIMSLYKQCVKPKNIRLFIDEDISSNNDIYSMFLCKNYSILETKQLKTEISKIHSKNIVIFILGHGDIEKGIIASPNIRPYKLLDYIASNKYSINIIIFLNQCYAGIFQDIDISNINNQRKILFVGASNLTKSLSYKIEKINWKANLFLYYIFKWIQNPKDIDCDKKFTIMDAFKYASAKLNDDCLKYKETNFDNAVLSVERKNILLEHIGRAVIKNLNKNYKIPTNIKLNIEKINEDLKQPIEFCFHNQEPWISNKKFALAINFKKYTKQK